MKIKNPRFVRQDYTLCPVSMAVDYAGIEPNDSAALAADLAVGQPRTGVLTTDADIDCRKVAFAEQTSYIPILLWQSTNRNTAFVPTVEQNGKTQWTANIKGDSGGIEQSLRFPAGEYCFRLKSLAWLGTVYAISLD